MEENPSEINLLETNEGTLLGGRVRHIQPAHGHRTSLEPVLLAAAVPARPGERILEGGSGSGAALLCLAARVPGIEGLGVECDPQMAALATANAAANGFSALSFQAADLTATPLGGDVHHAIANPPWHGTGTASPEPRHETARRGAPGLIAAWARALTRPLVARGTLTLVLAAQAVPEGLAALDAAGCGSLALFPLWPRVGRPARLALLRGIKGGRTPFRLGPGLVLHEGTGFSATAEAVLREGAPLEI